MNKNKHHQELAQCIVDQILSNNDVYDAEIEDEDDSLLYEMASIGQAQLKSKGKKYFVAVHYDPNRIGDPYFRFYKTSSFQKNAQCARISFFEAKYVIHPDASNKHFNLDSKQKKSLIKFMNSASSKNDYEQYTNWQTAIMKYNDEAVMEKPNGLKWQQCTQAFMKANKRMFSRGQLRNVLPIDLPMPDYGQLPE